jgi:tetratricopeptide (TPR) repeat protein
MYRIISYAAAALLTASIGAAPALAGDAETCKMSSGEDGIAACSRVIARQPKSSVAYYNRALAYGRKADYDRAIADLDQAIRRNSKNANFYTERCWAYDSKRNYDRAIADCEQAVKLDPTKVVIYGQRADAGAGNDAYNSAMAGEAAGWCQRPFT